MAPSGQPDHPHRLRRSPPRVEYALTPPGCGLHEIVTSLIGWAADHHDEIRAHPARVAQVADIVP
ncbi:winged helix-turn-helix transcriptional regulator [Streptomyces sp. NPDC056696]|uniref:winged helix-turn-helix transcriptional regulator n=1 Tax=unclassified Streptomyces TaxID=2593676 RepID=UPI00362608B4